MMTRQEWHYVCLGMDDCIGDGPGQLTREQAYVESYRLARRDAKQETGSVRLPTDPTPD